MHTFPKWVSEQREKSQPPELLVDFQLAPGRSWAEKLGEEHKAKPFQHSSATQMQWG